MAQPSKILLSQGKHALVDDEDYVRVVSLGKWTAHNQGYAYRWDKTLKPRKCILMHRIVTNAPQDLEVDHINGDRLDNRRSNLRTVDRFTNSLNRTSKGIEGSKYWRGYCIRICAGGQRFYFGRYQDAEEAKHTSKYIKSQLLEALL